MISNYGENVLMEETEAQLFNVVFDGKPLPDVTIEKASEGLARLTRKNPKDIAHLFNERSTLLKRNITMETALQYLQTMRNAGLACHIENAASQVKEEKVTESSASEKRSVSPFVSASNQHLENRRSVQQPSATQQQNRNKESHWYNFPKRGWVISIATLSFLLDQNLNLDSAPSDLPEATIGRRLWSAVSTFFHGIFMGYVLAFPVGLVVGLFLRFTDADVTKTTFEAIRGGTALIGIATSVLLVPLLWRGHSFGQRALGILVVPDKDDDVNNLNGLEMMIKRMSFQTRCVCKERVLSRPWNSALIPFAAIIILHFIFIPFSLAFMSVSNSSTSSSMTAYKKTTRAEKTLRELRPAIHSYLIMSLINGDTPFTPELFKQAINKHVPPHIANGLLKKMKKGDLLVGGVIAEYRVGIREKGQWVILEARGNIYRAETF